jgi:hypothetical protein
MATDTPTTITAIPAPWFMSDRAITGIIAGPIIGIIGRIAPSVTTKQARYFSPIELAETSASSIFLDANLQQDRLVQRVAVVGPHQIIEIRHQIAIGGGLGKGD